MNGGVLVLGALAIRALLLRVYIRAPGFGKLPSRLGGAFGWSPDPELETLHQGLALWLLKRGLKVSSGLFSGMEAVIVLAFIVLEFHKLGAPFW